MDSVVVDDITTEPFEEAVSIASLGDALSLESVAINRFRLESGARLPWGLHAHEDQEEVFLVTEGAVTFETLTDEHVIEAGAVIGFHPGEFQVGTNPADHPATVVAIGAPPDSRDIRVPLPCPDCPERAMRIDHDEGGLVCPTCGGERSGQCPDCGAETVEARPGSNADEIRHVCRSCSFETTLDR